MDFELGKKSGQIPAFGDWDNASDVPITQYFETARAAGLVRYNTTTTATTTHRHHNHHHHQFYDDHPYNIKTGNGCYHGCAYSDELHAADFLQKPPIRVVRVPKHKGEIHGGVVDNRRRGGCPPQHKEQKQRIKEAYGYEDVEVNLKHHHQQQQQHQQKHRTRRSSTGSQQLYYGQNQKMKQFPKHSVPIARDVLPTYEKPAVVPPTTSASANVKPVDEDLYKIPPELLLHHSKKKKMLGFFSKCLVPPCRT